MEKNYITLNGFGNLQAELRRLKNHDRPEIIKAIAEARSHGDLSENAEYHAAKEQQEFIERKIIELEEKIANAEVIDPSQLSGNTIKFGATVSVRDEDSGNENKYQIVGKDESDINKGLLSITAPLGKALIGKKAKDVVEVRTPNGSKEFTILGVKYS